MVVKNTNDAAGEKYDHDVLRILRLSYYNTTHLTRLPVLVLLYDCSSLISKRIDSIRYIFTPNLDVVFVPFVCLP
jgi:hypothetical protein